MQRSTKLNAGSPFPTFTLHSEDDDRVKIGAPRGANGWVMVVVYRGRHCPLCTKYLNLLESFRRRLAAIEIDLCAVSGDSRAQLSEHRSRLNVGFPLYGGMSVEQMQSLGLYISQPRSEKETDHPFAEPGLFVVNAEGRVQVVDISNNPFVRPELEGLVSGLEWIRNPENHYPIRGTYSHEPQVRS